MPLSPLQISKRAREWGAVCRVNHWHMTDGRIDPRATRTGPGAPGSDPFPRIWSLAEFAARQDHCAITADHLRRACNALAIGHFKSWTAFDNADLDRLFVLYRLLINPLDIAAGAEWSLYQKRDEAKRHDDHNRHHGLKYKDRAELPEDPGQRRRLLAAIQNKGPEAWIISVAEDICGIGKDWRFAPVAKLLTLNRALAKRAKNWRKPISNPGSARVPRAALGVPPSASTVPETANCPF